MRSNNWHPKNIESYLKKYYSNQESKDTARVYLKAFFTTMKKEPETYIKETKQKEILDDLFKYAEHIEKRAKKTQAVMLSMIKKYITRNDIIIPESKWEDILIRNQLKKQTKAIAMRKTPTQTDLKKILSYADIKSKSLFSFCAASGLRIDEALSLTFDHIDMENRMIDLRDDIAKEGNQRFTFFTPETKELLKLWIPERQKALQRMYKKSKYLRDKMEKDGFSFKRVKEANRCYYWKAYDKNGKEITKEMITKYDNRIWPFDYVNAQRMWTLLLEKAGEPFNMMDRNPKFKDGGKHPYNIHSLRRFWFTQLSTNRANDEYVQFMGGHTTDLKQTYLNYYENPVYRTKMKEEYDNHIGALSIFESTPSDIRESLKEKDDKIKLLEQELEGLKFRMKMVEKISEMDNKINKIKSSS